MSATGCIITHSGNDIICKLPRPRSALRLLCIFFDETSPIEVLNWPSCSYLELIACPSDIWSCPSSKRSPCYSVEMAFLVDQLRGVGIASEACRRFDQCRV